MQREQATGDHTYITEVPIVVDILLIIAGVLLAATVMILAKYLRQLHAARTEYAKAKGAVEDIILSFNRQFKRGDERMELVAYKVEANTSRSDRAISKAEEIEKQLQVTHGKFDCLSEDRDKEIARLSEVEQRIRDVTMSQETLTTRLTTFEEQMKQLSVSPVLSAETVIPLRRDKALAPLTGTELAALEILAAEGSKTAPEIKERIKLSREHTARLMKKLYEEGYMERDPSKIPFKYSVKKEMEKLLKKTEAGAL
jgi:uncharacterized protein